MTGTTSYTRLCTVIEGPGRKPGWSPSDMPSGPKAAIALTASECGLRLGAGLGNKPWSTRRRYRDWRRFGW